MVKFLTLLLALLVAVPVSAACAWGATTAFTRTVTCADGDEPGPTLATEGVPLVGIRAVSVVVSADAGQTFTAAPAGTIAVYLYDPAVGRWARCRTCSEATIDAASSRDQPIAWSVVSRRGRVAFVPIGVTLSAGGLTMTVTTEPDRK